MFIKIIRTGKVIFPHSSDYRLAGFEYYDHSAGYQLGGNNSGSFADFSYYLVTASINLKF